MTDKTRMNMSLNRRGIPAHNKLLVIQYDLNNNFINEFESITKASEETGTFRTCIVNNLKNRIKTAGGYKWHYQQRKLSRSI